MTDKSGSHDLVKAGVCVKSGSHDLVKASVCVKSGSHDLVKASVCVKSGSHDLVKVSVCVIHMYTGITPYRQRSEYMQVHYGVRLVPLRLYK